jgi:hypothetical protein
MDRLLTSRIARGLLGPITYVASLCVSVGTYHTLVDQPFVRDLLPNVSPLGYCLFCHQAASVVGEHSTGACLFLLLQQKQQQQKKKKKKKKKHNQRLQQSCSSYSGDVHKLMLVWTAGDEGRQPMLNFTDVVCMCVFVCAG